MCYKIAVSSNGIIYVSSYDGNIAYWNEGDWKIVARTGSIIHDLVVDSFHDILLVESIDHRIRKVSPSSGEIRPFAGSEEEGHSNGLLLESTFRYPHGIAMDRSSIYISDFLNHTIRRIDILGLWNRGKTSTTRFSTLFRKSFPLSSKHEEADSSGDDPFQERKWKRLVRQITERYLIFPFSVCNEGRNLLSINFLSTKFFSFYSLSERKKNISCKLHPRSRSEPRGGIR